MATGDVKITDLTQAMSAETTDLFLLARPFINSEGAFENTPYSNYSVSGDALFDSVGESIRKKPLNITGKWNFQGGKNNSPTQNLKIQPGHFVEHGLEVPEHLSSIVDDSEDGWYKRLTTSVMQDPSHRSGQEQSIGVPNDTIPNIDFVQRLVAQAYNSLNEKLMSIYNGKFIPSHVGQIIHSTTLASVNDLQAIYGYHTDWLRHAGYFLRGAETNDPVVPNSGSSGGQNKVQITSNNLPNHSHTATFNGSKSSVSISVSSSSKFGYAIGSTTAGVDGKHKEVATKNLFTQSVKSSGSAEVTPKGTVTINLSGGSSNPTPIETVPRYKNVYIWERIA